MMHGLAVLCGPSVLFRNGVPAPGKSVSVTAEAPPVSANIAAVAPIPIQAKRILPIMTHSLDPWVSLHLQGRCEGQAIIFGRRVYFLNRSGAAICAKY